MTITDASGGVLKTLPLGASKAGTIDYDWDGKTEAGEDAGTGPFKVSVRAQDGGTSVASHSLVWSPVESVNMTGAAPTLSLPGIGRQVLLGISQKEFAVVQSTVLVIAMLFVIVNLLTDLLYRRIDPRVRAA